MTDVLIFLVWIVAWIVLQRWLLPRMGVPT